MWPLEAPPGRGRDSLSGSCAERILAAEKKGRPGQRRVVRPEANNLIENTRPSIDIVGDPFPLIPPWLLICETMAVIASILSLFTLLWAFAGAQKNSGDGWTSGRGTWYDVGPYEHCNRVDARWWGAENPKRT